MTLITVLVALLIFAFSLLALAGLYTRLVSAQLGNELTTSTQTIGNRFWALLQAQPAMLGAIGSSATYTSANVTSAPAVLQPLLRDVFSSQYVNLPGASVTIATGNDALGTACNTATPSTTICGVTLSLTWTAPGGGPARRQVFAFQVGGF